MQQRRAKRGGEALRAVLAQGVRLERVKYYVQKDETLRNDI